MIRPFTEGGWSAQELMHEQGLVCSPICPGCDNGIGSLFHRLRVCPLTSGIRPGMLAEAVGISGKPRAGEARTDTLSMCRAEAHVPFSPG